MAVGLAHFTKFVKRARDSSDSYRRAPAAFRFLPSVPRPHHPPTEPTVLLRGGCKQQNHWFCVPLNAHSCGCGSNIGEYIGSTGYMRDLDASSGFPPLSVTLWVRIQQLLGRSSQRPPPPSPPTRSLREGAEPVEDGPSSCGGAGRATINRFSARTASILWSGASIHDTGPYWRSIEVHWNCWMRCG